MIDRFFGTPVGMLLTVLTAGLFVWYCGAVVYYTLAAVLSWFKCLCHC